MATSNPPRSSSAELFRPSDLANVDWLLMESVRQLTANADPELFLESLVRVLADSIGASPVTLFEFDASQRTLAMRIHYCEGVIRRGLCGDEVALFAAPFPAEITPAWAASLHSGGRFLTERAAPETVAMAWPGLLAWMQRIGATDGGLVALFVGEEPVGALGISWTKNRKPKPSAYPLVEALARQTAVGLRLVKLADAARENAVAEANDKASAERTAELTRAGDAVNRNRSSLMLQKNAGEFLEALLLDACAVCGAISASIFRRRSEEDTMQMAAFVTAGGRVDLATDPRMEIWRRSFPTEVALATALTKLLEGELVWFDNEEPNPKRQPKIVEWHRLMGHRIVAMVPTSVGSTFLGFIGLCFAEPVPPTPERLAQARTFAGHASLALQLTRLTEDLRREVSARAEIGERNRIARDLHDTLAQGFTGILAQLGVAEGALDRKGEPSRDELRHALSRAEELARSSLAEARRSVSEMRDYDESRAPSLEAGLQILLKRMTSGTRLSTRLRMEADLPQLPSRLEETLRRIAQEALTNTLKHAGPEATEFSLHLVCREGYVCLIARDNGRGFDTASENNQSEGLGLIGMRERAALAGGLTTVSSAPGEGTEVKVELPFRCRNDA